MVEAAVKHYSPDVSGLGCSDELPVINILPTMVTASQPASQLSPHHARQRHVHDRPPAGSLSQLPM